MASLGLMPLACGMTTSRGTPEETRGGSGGSGGDVGGPHAAGKGGSIIVAGSGGHAGSGGRESSCGNPMKDPVTGLVTCENGSAHRPAAVACEAVGGAPADEEAGGAGGAGETPNIGPLPRADGSAACSSDAECRGFELGYCDQDDAFDLSVCLSGCLIDSDCGKNAVCICSDRPSATAGKCVPTNDCAVDADCGPGSTCSRYQGFCGDAGFACTSNDDACLVDADCSSRQVCIMEAGRRVCEDGLVCGRPFLVGEKARVAWVEPGRSWLGRNRPRPSTEHLTPSERAELAAHWTRMGQMEHASIAAFARFQLQLLALGAPAELVEGCTQALADETTHTRLCFDLASAYAERNIGPGPLDVADSLDAVSLEDVLELVLLEGCFGETSAALEAIEAAEHAVDPVIVAAYDQIAADEQRHAELAFRFVRWALAQGGRAARKRVLHVLESPPRVGDSVRSVTVPCLSALLGSLHDELPAS